MAKYKYKIAEEKETFSATEVDPALIQRVEKTYGPVDMKNDFFSSDLKTYFKTKSVDPNTGAVDSQVIKLASFTDSLEKLYIATEALSALVKSPGGKDDAVVVKSYDDLKTMFNNFRSHLRKYYPDQYEAIKNKLDEMSTISSNSGFTSGGEGENYATPFAFSRTKSTKGNYGAYTQAGYKKVNEFKYKLAKPQLKEADTNVEQYLQDLNVVNPDNKKFIASRLMGFDEVETKLNQLLPLLQQAKHETMDYYRKTPESFSIVYGTDLANDYLNDLIELFKK
jgi:hypothetical protein